MESIHFYYSFIIKITYFICRSNCFNFQDCYNYITIEGRKKFVPKSLPKKKKRKKKWRIAIRDRSTRYIYRHACRCTRQGRNLEQPQTDFTAREIADCDWLLACRFLRPDSTENKCKTARRGRSALLSPSPSPCDTIFSNFHFLLSNIRTHHYVTSNEEKDIPFFF